MPSHKPRQQNFECASLGAEIMLAMQRSADEQVFLIAKLVERQVSVSCEQNRKEFGLA